MTFLQKSMKVVKDYFFILALVATFIGFSAFKFIPTKVSTLWYDVYIKDDGQPHDDPENLGIVTSSGTSTPPSDPCDQSTGILCAVELTLGSPSVPEDMQEALDRQQANEDDVKIEDESFRTTPPSH